MPEIVNETTNRSEFERLAALPDRCEIRIVIAEEKLSASVAMDREDHGTPGSIANALAVAVLATMMRTTRDLSRILAVAGIKTETRVAMKESAR